MSRHGTCALSVGACARYTLSVDVDKQVAELVMSTAILSSAFFEKVREPGSLSAFSLTTGVVLLCAVVSALLLAFEFGQYPCGKWYFRPRRVGVF